jgi:hypothetical protein
MIGVHPTPPIDSVFAEVGFGAIPLKNGRAIGYNCVVFANLDGWGAVDDGGA